MNISQNIGWGRIWNEQRVHFKTTIFDNIFIPQKPFLNQIKFIIYPNEELALAMPQEAGKVLLF